jgi:hypothetical protein
MLIKLALMTVMTLGFASAIFAVELRDASSQQILDELAFRLRSGTPGGGARASYICDNSNYLKISVVSPTGSEATESVYIGNPTNCASQMQILNANRSRINGVTVASICDSSAYLKRFSITTAGALAELDSRYIGNITSCMNQAESLNTGNLNFLNRN